MIINEKPPVWDMIVKAFPVHWDDGIIVTYGENIYSKEAIPPLKVAHELVHVKQQTTMGKDIWWERYIRDNDFRLSQEIEAYTEEYSKAKQVIKDRNALAKYLFTIATHLSSSMYGSIITHSEALKSIKNGK